MTDIDPDKARRIADAAARALKEAEKRREETPPQTMPTELGGRDGPEPTRFGDWEKNGVLSDF